MGRSINVDINSVNYSGVTASAKDQVEMLQIAATSGLLPVMSGLIKDMGLMASMASIDSASFNRLKTLCLTNGNVVRDSDNMPVAENLFQDEAHNFFVLVGRVLKENIGPFWQLSEKDGNEQQSNELGNNG